MIVSTVLSHIITAAKLYNKSNTLTVTTCTRPIRLGPRPSMKIFSDHNSQLTILFFLYNHNTDLLQKDTKF